MKIIQTINCKPSESDTLICSKIQSLLDSNCSQIRINLKNFTVTDIERVKRLLACVKRTDTKHKLNISIDIPSSKIKYRINTNTIQNIKNGELIKIWNNSRIISSKNSKCTNYIDSSFFSFLENICLEEIFFWADGEAKLKLVEKNSDYLTLKAMNEFCLFDNKSISNIYKNFSLNDEQKEFLVMAMQNFNISNVFLSFCEDPKEIIELKNLLFNVHIHAKIETSNAVNNLNGILDVADGIMIARGDLALNIPVEDFLNTQDYIANITNNKNKKLFVATDILTSLNKQEFPSRADLCDIEKILTYYPEAIILKAAIFHNNRFFKIKKFIEDIS